MFVLMTENTNLYTTGVTGRVTKVIIRFDTAQLPGHIAHILYTNWILNIQS